MTPDPDFEQVLEEILTRRAAGEQPTPEEYIAKYPRYANQLVEHFETLRVLEELMREEGAAPPPTRSSMITFVGEDRPGGWGWFSWPSRCRSNEMWH